MEEKPNYYAIIPSEIRYDNSLKDKAKLLYSEITSLSNKDGYCYATNKYFADLYGVSITTISLLIKQLVDRGYIKSEIIYKEGTKEILNRYLKIIKEGYLRKVKDNNINTNNKNNNKKEIYKERFKKPTLEEIKAYCKERNNNVNPRKFYDYYEANNWVDNKGNKVKSWKQKIITWEGRNKDKQQLPDWFDKEIKSDNTKNEDIKELEDWINNYE